MNLILPKKFGNSRKLRKCKLHLTVTTPKLLVVKVFKFTIPTLSPENQPLLKPRVLKLAFPSHYNSKGFID